MANISNPAGAYGYSSLEDKLYHLDVPFVSGESSTTIAKGDVVVLNTSGKIEQSATGDDANTVIGVAREQIVAGDVGLVTILGYAVANCESSLAAGATVGRSGTTAGRAASVTAGAGGIFGSVIVAEASNQCGVWIGGANN